MEREVGEGEKRNPMHNKIMFQSVIEIAIEDLLLEIEIIYPFKESKTYLRIYFLLSVQVL